MYQFDDVGSMYISLPPNLQNIENACFAYAFDRQIRKLHALAKKLTIWSDLDNADPRYYDYMAITIRAPYYRSEYGARQKLELIKSALESRIYAGTMKAIEGLLSRSILNARFVPWHDYGGSPYHFKIETSNDPAEEARRLFSDMLQRVKAARSIIDGVEIDHDPLKNTVFIGISMSRYRTAHVHNKEKPEYKVRGTIYAGCTAVMKKEIAIKEAEQG